MRQSDSRSRAFVCFAFGGLLLTPNARAIETAPIDGTPASVDVVESAGALYNADNRNTRRSDVASLADDNWGLLSNRIEARANWGHWQLGLRLDSAWFWTSQSPTRIALRALEQEHGGRLPTSYSPSDANLFVDKFFQAGDELSDRFIHWNYPAKYSLSYTTPDVEATLGDFTAQFGRGLVLSVRKQDQLSGDTTIRGARASYFVRSDDARLRLTALAGVMNPLRIDDGSGRVLGTAGAGRDGIAGLAEAGMPQPVNSAFDPSATPNYAPDRLLGGEIEVRSKPFAVSLAGARLLRACTDTDTGCQTLSSDLVRSAHTIDNLGAGFNVPNLWQHGSLYVEYAHQALHDFSQQNVPDVSGNAVYANLTLAAKPFTFSVDAKHYRSFYPLRANVDIGRAREFSPIQYSTSPTTMPVWTDTEFEGFNTCVTGGRARADWQASTTKNLYLWVGRYDTWAESVAATSCSVQRANANHVWDLAEGAQFSSRDRSARGEGMLGARFDSMDRTVLDAAGAPTQVFYRELYARYEITLPLGGAYALEFQGWHRRRRQTLGGPEKPWLQGTTVTGLQWGPKLNLAFGFEYDQNPAFPGLYLNGQLRYELEEHNRLLPWVHAPSYLSLFVGQRQGGLRCVSGVCRVYAPFEGARLDLTLAF